MTDLGKTLREARQAAGVTLRGMARRTGYSGGYLGNVETGTRMPTPALIRAYERVLGDDVNRRVLLAGLAAGLAASSAASPDLAVDVFRDIAAERHGLLSRVQTSHETDRVVSHLVARDLGTLGSLSKWATQGSAVLRVNSLGIMAKVGSPGLDSDVAIALKGDDEARLLYLTAVAARVFTLPWDEAGNIATNGRVACTPVQLRALAAEVGNPSDSGARWCSVVLLHRLRSDFTEDVDAALRNALGQESSREILRAIGSVLAGLDPLRI